MNDRWLGFFKTGNKKRATSLRRSEKWPYLLLIESRRRNRWEFNGWENTYSMMQYFTNITSTMALHCQPSRYFPRELEIYFRWHFPTQWQHTSAAQPADTSNKKQSGGQFQRVQLQWPENRSTKTTHRWWDSLLIVCPCLLLSIEWFIWISLRSAQNLLKCFPLM